MWNFKASHQVAGFGSSFVKKHNEIRLNLSATSSEKYAMWCRGPAKQTLLRGVSRMKHEIPNLTFFSRTAIDR